MAMGSKFMNPVLGTIVQIGLTCVMEILRYYIIIWFNQSLLLSVDC